ncbi:hypothetical protein HKX48_004345 [Thoreauomyces humboldtii]|nr:hypothetical protein HKX48_004345 [Thoreauomyces humboldtii]
MDALHRLAKRALIPCPQTLRATGFCTAEAYDFSALLPLLQRSFVLLPYIADDVYHVRLIAPEDGGVDLTSGAFHDAEAFIFRDGTLATWGASEEANEAILALVKAAEINSYRAPETEWFHYGVDMEQTGGLTADTILIGDNGLPATQSRLAYSSGLARSVKLASLEEMLDSHLEKNRHIPQVLLQGRKIPLTRAQVLQNLGELFSLRGHLNLHSELLDSPDFCWSSQKMEDIFERISRNLDVRPRIAVFNKKLDYANELTEVIRNHLHTQHSTTLEWAIIILIMIEVGFQIFHTYEGWDREGGGGTLPAGATRKAVGGATGGGGTMIGTIPSDFLADDAVEEHAPKQPTSTAALSAARLAKLNAQSRRDLDDDRKSGRD